MIIRNGGHIDQLSNKFWGMDRFRLKSIYKIIREGNLKTNDLKAAKNMFLEKYYILTNGFKKRNKVKELNFFKRLKNKLFNSY